MSERVPEVADVPDSPKTDDDRAIEFARAALARARSHTRGFSRSATRSGGFTTRRHSAGDPAEPTFSGAGPDARDPALLGSAVTNLVTELGWQGQVNVAGVISRWPSIVGADIAAHSVIEAFEVRNHGSAGLSLAQVVVRTDSTTWATQLRLLSTTLCQRLTEDLGAEFEVQMRILAPSAPTWRHGARHVPGRGPRDTYG